MRDENQFDLLDRLGLYHLDLDAIDDRRLRAGDRPLIDFVSTNYLGLDFDPHLHACGEAITRRWGSLAGWSRMELDPAPYRELEQRLATFLGAGSTMLSHTITLTNISLIPGIVGRGHILADARLHTVVWEACRLARDHGAHLTKFAHQDMAHLETLLRALPHGDTKLIAVDGVYSISGAVAPILELQALCRTYNAWLYVDDAHGFGVLGESPSADNPYGGGGGGTVRFCAGDAERTFYVASFGKAFGVQAAFATIPRQFRSNVRAFCLQYLFSAPFSPYTVGQVHGALDLNERQGEAARQRLRGHVARFVGGLQRAGVACENVLQQPIVYVPVGDFEQLVHAAAGLLDDGVIAGFRVYPLVPRDQCGFRFALTALHTEAQIDHAVAAMARLAAAGRLARGVASAAREQA